MVGDEILLGKTQDTNTVKMAEFLLERGIKIRRWVIVPDNTGEIIISLRRMIDDGLSPIVVSGGMGPTHDDLTVPAVAEALGLELVRSELCLERMMRKWKKRHPGEEIEGTSKAGLEKMSYVPSGFQCVENRRGMAEGLVGKIKGGDTGIYMLPGVPGEYRSVMGDPMFVENLPEHVDGNVGIQEIPFRGRESQIAYLLSDFQDEFPRVDIGSYPRDQGNVMIRITGLPENVERAASAVKDRLEKFQNRKHG